MAYPVVVIDGYNALLTLAELERDYPEGYRFSLEREYFLQVLEKKKSKGEWIIVFDGKENILRIERKGELWVIFTPENEEADEIIVKIVSGGKIGKPPLQLSITDQRMCVITDDRELRRRVKAARPSIEIRGIGFLN